MPVLRVVILWHQHQPLYKDLVTGEYRLPWVRMHALKDYYGMVKLLEEFPSIHQTFNLVPSLITQIQDYAAGTAQDPFLAVAAKPAKDLTRDERRFALQYLFQANPVHLIGRYPRYKELWDRFRSSGALPERAEPFFLPQDFTDLQVLSQISWFDEFFLEQKDVAELVRKGRNYSLEDQRFVMKRERELLAAVLPAHSDGAKRGGIEISTSPFYHPILPLVCDTNQGGISTPDLPLPKNHFRRPEDAREQLLRGLNLHEQVFGIRPKGVWPSEGSVSEEVLSIAHQLGVNWMATDEGVLGRSLGFFFTRDGGDRLNPGGPERLYTLYQYEKNDTRMNLLFRDHTMSDLIGFVYSGMPPRDAAKHLIHTIRQAAQPVLDQGRDAVVSIILDGENAWEYYDKSGREFLRYFYDALRKEAGLEAVTVSEAISRHKNFAQLGSLVSGSWISANFNVWIGAPEDNRSWDYLHAAREFYERTAPGVTEKQRALAMEELLIAEGSDWNWWYGPEHHSANDRDFDELYRKHLSNVYSSLGAAPPEYLAQPITSGVARPAWLRQTAYVRPQIDGTLVRYFEWIGAAIYTSDRRSGSMHGKQFLLDAAYAGINEKFVCGRLDFAGSLPDMDFNIVVNLESTIPGGTQPYRVLRLEAAVENHALQRWTIAVPPSGKCIADNANNPDDLARVALRRVFEFRVPLEWLSAPLASSDAAVELLRMRFSLWHDNLPVDALPLEGWIDLPLVSEDELLAMA